MSATTVALLRQTAAVLVLGTAALHAQQHVWSSSPLGLVERSTTTLDLIRVVNPTTGWLGGPWTSDGDWLWTTTNPSGTQPASLWRGSLGDGVWQRTTLSGPTFLPEKSLAYDPAANLLRSCYGVDWYTIDRSTGAVAFEQSIGGFGLPWHVPSATTFASDGTAYAICFSYAGSNAIYSVPPSSLSAVYLGELYFGVPSEQPWTFCAAYEGPGRLLLSYERLVGVGGGLVRVDLASLSCTEIQVWSQALGGGAHFATAPPTEQTTYCTARTNSLGCTPTIRSVGYASASASFGFTVRATEVINNSNGLLLWSLGARNSLPFHGATLCVTAPLYRTPILNSGHKITGPVTCQAVWERDLNRWWHDTVPMPAGVTVRCQWFGRDPGYSAPQDAQTSNALEFVLRP